MTEAVHARPLVRPRFLRWSIVMFVLLLPFAAHALWDYLESARLAGNIAAVRQNGEPVSVYQINPSPRAVDGEEAEAERLYLAAADLVRPDSSRPVRMPVRIEAAERTGEWPADLLSQIRAHVREHDDAFRLLDRAAPLVHPGFVHKSSVEAARC